MTWPVSDAKARFSELLDATLTEGPQIVTRRGVETAVVIPMAEWKRLNASTQPTLKDLLLDLNGLFFEDLVPPRVEMMDRPVVDFE